MERLEGRKIFDGIAIGRIFFYSREQKKVVRRRISDEAAEFARYREAKEKAAQQLKGLYEKALASTGERDAQIFEAHLVMLEDYDLNASVTNMIENQHINAEYAVAITGDSFAARFENMEDEFFRARGEDIRDVTERILGILMGEEQSISLNETCIIAAQDLTPGETLQMDRDKLLAFVTHRGSASSHTAILARALNVPAIAGIEVSADWDGRTAVIDGNNAVVILDPDETVLGHYKKVRAKEQERARLLEELKGKETITKGGRRIRLYANIGSLDDLEAALQNDAEGIGLFRSEFLFLESDSVPTEEQQFEIYRQAAGKMAGKKVVIRTLDIGADKQMPYMEFAREENPAMGCRAIRMSLMNPGIFKPQLRAILRASHYGNIAVMYPMITSVEEVRRIKQLVDEVKKELTKESIVYGEPEQGIMIETPAAALISDLLAKEVDFFSIGTNDLTQYTLAIDRQNSELEQFFNPRHEAVMRLIRMVVENAHKAGIWAGICGMLAADTSLTESFINMGIDELSVSAGMVLKVRRAVRQLD